MSVRRTGRVPVLQVKGLSATLLPLQPYRLVVGVPTSHPSSLTRPSTHPYISVLIRSSLIPNTPASVGNSAALKRGREEYSMLDAVMVRTHEGLIDEIEESRSDIRP